MGIVAAPKIINTAKIIHIIFVDFLLTDITTFSFENNLYLLLYSLFYIMQ